MNIIEKLKGLGVEITPEIEKAFGGEYISQQEHEKKLQKAEMERDTYKADYETDAETLKGFEGKDFEGMSKEVEEWKKKAEQAEKDFAEKLSQRDYKDALKELTKDLKFTSKGAEKAFMADLEENPLQMREGKVLGFDDYLKAYKENDENAFVKEENPNRSTFTGSIGGNNGGGTSADIAKMRAVMGLSNDNK